MVRTAFMCRRYFFMLYWLAFAILSIKAANDPGYVLHPETAAFPWRGLIFTWMLLGVAIGILYIILRSLTLKKPWRRLVIALIFSASLLAICIVTFFTDMPGLYYVPTWFSLITFAGLVIFTLVLFAFKTWEHYGKIGR